MLSKVFSAALLGLDAQIIEVETDVSYGLRHFEIVGLPDKAVEESKERVGAAIESSGFQSPHHQPERVLVSLAPADLKKEGSIYDLPIALGYLLSAEKIKFDPSNKIFLGELALDGRLRPIKGVICFAIACREKGFSELILPKENALEASLIGKIKVIGVGNLRETIDYLAGKKEIESGKEISTEKFTTMIKYKTYTWDITYRKIWTYDLLILISGILLFIVFGQSDNHTMKESTKKKLQELLVRALQEKKDQQQEKEE